MNYCSAVIGNIKLICKIVANQWNPRKKYIASFPQMIAHDTVLRIKQGEMLLGRKVRTHRRVYLSVVHNGVMKIGAHVFFNQNCLVVCQNSISIGDGCMFGPNVCIFDHDHKFDSSGVYGDCKTGPIEIGKNCWVGAGAIILRNTVIGEGSIIGAGTVVKGEIPPHSIVTNERGLVIKPIKDKLHNAQTGDACE